LGLQAQLWEIPYDHNFIANLKKSPRVTFFIGVAPDRTESASGTDAGRVRGCAKHCFAPDEPVGLASPTAEDSLYASTAVTNEMDNNSPS